MIFDFESRLSDSPLVEMIWRTQSDTDGTFISQAVSHSEIVITRYKGNTTVTLRGPETKATIAYCPPDAEFFGITFKLGVFMPHLPVGHLTDGSINLPEARSNSIWLASSVWEIPDFDNADTFLQRLEHGGLLVREPLVESAMQGRLLDHLRELSLRSVQRRFLRSTGLTHTTIFQIERAQRAVALLKHGASILDTVDLAGYADQPHLTRSLRRYVGLTPVQLVQQATQHYIPTYIGQSLPLNSQFELQQAILAGATC
jgi:AraC-like DNA-binding protein